MKLIRYKFLCALGVLALFASCDKEDRSVYPLKEILSSGYWLEDIRLLYNQEGVPFISDEELNDEYVPSYFNADTTLLGIISIDPQSYAIRQYANVSGFSNPRYEYYDRGYVISIDEKRQTVCITIPDAEFMEKNAVAGVEMQVASVSENAIVFYVPFKPYIWKHGYYETGSGLGDLPLFEPKREYRCLYVTWIKSRHSDLLDQATPRE